MTAGAWRSRFTALVDPDWLPFVGVLLVPALVSLVVGAHQSAVFFAGTALYLGVLKWLGRILVTRHVRGVPGYLLFPADLFVGLAAGIVWFYLRNLIARVWPGSYGLVELRLLPYLAVVVNAAGVLIRREVLRKTKSEWFAWAGLSVPFVLALVVATWQVSTSFSVQSSDPLIHAYIARSYEAAGLDARPLPGGRPFIYPAGFAAMNVLTMSVAPLNVVQALNLQHVVWNLIGLFLVPVAMRALAGGPFGILGGWPLLFLAFFPIYALQPMSGYEGTPRQSAAPLLLAAALLPMFSVDRCDALVGRAAAQVVLGVLGVVQNPSCAPFAALCLLIGGVAHWRDVRQNAGVRLRSLVPLHGMMVLLLAALLIGLDPYYSRLLTGRGTSLGPEVASPMLGPAFSVAAGLPTMGQVNPLVLSPSVGVDARPDSVDHTLKVGFNGWPEKAFAPLVLLLAFLAVLWSLRARGTDAVSSGLRRLLVFGLLLWFVERPLLTFAQQGLSLERDDTSLLRVYLGSMQVRCEMLLLFVCLVASTALLATTRSRRPNTSTVGIMIAPMLMILPAGIFLAVALFGENRHASLTMPKNLIWECGEDDLRLVRWIDGHISPEEGSIALQALPFSGGIHNKERHVDPYGGAVAVVLYGHRINYRFFGLCEEPDAADLYRDHLQHSVDLDWCQRQGIRYFYLTERDWLQQTQGWRTAVQEGRLRLVHREGGAGLYERSPAPPP